MRSVVIAGASGLVGARCLHHLLAHDEVERVTAFVRRPLGITHSKLQERPLETLAPLDMPKDVEDAYCALGTTMKQAGTREQFIKVDRDMVVKFARAAREAGARRFILVSAQGADPRSVAFYMRVKGDVERDITRLGFDQVAILRPSVLEGDRKQSRPGEAFAVTAMTAVSRIFGGTRFKYAPIHVDTVGRAMVKLAFSDVRGVTTVESPELQKIGAAPN